MNKDGSFKRSRDPSSVMVFSHSMPKTSLLMFISASFKYVPLWLWCIRMHVIYEHVPDAWVLRFLSAFILFFVNAVICPYMLHSFYADLCPWYKRPTAPSFRNHHGNFLMALPHSGFQQALTDQRRPLLAGLHDFNWPIKSHWSTFGCFWSAMI